MNTSIDKKKHPNCYKAFQYSKDILSGDIVSCWQIKAACERFERDLKDNRFFFDCDSAERVCRLLQKFVHIKGPLANTPLKFEPWQLFIYVNIFGFKWKTTNLRRFTKLFVLVSRKNGKSSIVAPLGNYMLSLDGEEGAEIYTVSNKKDQARIVFDMSREMAKRAGDFCDKTGTEVFRHHIEQDKTASVYKPLASDSNSLDGCNASTVIFDEVHSFKDRNLYGVMETSVGARPQPLLVCISTSGFDDTGICYELQVDLEKVLKQEYDDESQFGLIYTLDKGDDFRDESVWIKSNPNLGVSLSKDYIQGMVEKAIRQPANKNNVMTKHFNVWCTASENLFDMLAFDECADENLKIEDFFGENCYAGIDLASKIDLTAFAYIFKRDNKYYFFSNPFLPEAAIEKSSNSSYKGWVDQGYITATKGEAISYDYLEDYYQGMSRRLKFIDTHCDPWSANQFMQNMSKKRIEMTEFRMTTANVSEPLKFLDALIREKRFIHDGSPVTRWCFSNVVAKEDHNGNIYFRKTHAKFKIDVVVAATMALAGWINEEQKESVYQDRGMIFI